MDVGVKEDIVQKSGAWFSYNEIRLGQGRENAKQYMKDNPEVMVEIENKIREKHNLPLIKVPAAPPAAKAAEKAIEKSVEKAPSKEADKATK